MTPSTLRLVAPSLSLLLLSACGDEAEPLTTAPISAAPSQTPASSLVAQAQHSALTPGELAADPEPAAATDSRPERTESEGPDALEVASEGAESGGIAQESGTVTELEWEALIPEEWQPDKIMARYNADGLADDDPRAQELMDELQALWEKAPVVQNLDGKRVKLPGFVVPLDTDGQKTGEFLLVPYYGACIHVPPPPANQTVHVQTEKGHEYPGELFDTVWVIGTLRVESSTSNLAEAGYRLEATRIDPYE
jgi:hypothetical protein